MKCGIGGKLNGGFIVIMLIAMLSITYLASTSLKQISNNSSATYKDQTLPLVNISNIMVMSNKINIAILHMLLSSKDIEENIKKYEELQLQFNKAISNYEQDGSIPSQPKTQELLKRAGEHVYVKQLQDENDALKIIHDNKEKLTSDINTIIHALKNNDRATAEALYATSIKSNITQMREALETLTQLQLDQIKISFDEGARLVHSTYRYMFILIALVLTIGSLLFYLLTKKTISPLRDLVQAADAISTRGDLDQNITIKSNDEAGELAQSFRNVVNYLKEMASIAEKIAEGNLNEKVKIRSEKDAFGVAFKNMTNYLQTMAEISTQIAEGDLTQQINLRSEKDAFGVSFQNMLAGLRKSVIKTLTIAESVSSSSQQLSGSAQQINSTTQEIAATVQQIAKGSQEQAQQVEETTRVMEQMSITVEGIANNSHASAKTSIQAAEDAEKGNEAVQAAVTKMNKIHDVVLESAKTVQLLGKRSEEIGEIVNVITNIADQTNLLALNAAIEAARAGEAGRGFAVVAEEVRKLAEGSAKAASQISELINSIQKETSEAVQSMQLGNKEVQEGQEIAVKAGAALAEIIQAVQKTATSVQLIADSAQQMAVGTKQVAKTINEMATTAEQTASGAEETGASTEQMSASMQEIAASAQELSHMSMVLKDSMSQFKLRKMDTVVEKTGEPLKQHPLKHKLFKTKMAPEHIK